MEEMCPYCQGTGFEAVEGKEGAPAGVKRCRCRAQKEIERLSEGSRIPGRFSHCRMDTFNVYTEHRGNKVINPSLSVAFEHCRKFIEKYPDVKRGFCFMGPPGVGKTHLAVAVLKELVAQKGAAILFYDFQELLFGLRASFDEDSELSQQQVFSPVLEAEVLLLDDLGASRVTGWRRDMLGYVITARYNSRKTTFFTTSRLDNPAGAEDSLEDRIGARHRSRISEMCVVCHLEGKDFRKKEEKMIAASGRRA
ncbi:MAG: ATP-binding protein [bacterium]